jgi:hypothetical protein
MFSSTATVHVVKNPKKINHTTNFLITASTCEELSRYYREELYRHEHIKLFRPSWNSHITISKINFEEKYDIAMNWDKKEISFSYEPIVRYSGDNGPVDIEKIGRYYFIDVYSDDIRKIRAELGLPDFNKFHITIGILAEFFYNSNKKELKKM